VFRARAEYVLCLDADDVLTPTFLERSLVTLEAHPEAGFAYTDQQYFGAANTSVRVLEYDFHTLTRRNIVGVASVFRRSVWEEVGWFETHRRYEDWDFWIACGALGRHGVKAYGTHWCYRVRADGRFVTGGAPRDRRNKAQLVARRPELYTEAQRAWAAGVLAGDPLVATVADEAGVIPELGAFPPNVVDGARADASTADCSSPALAAARAMARHTGAPIFPVERELPAEVDGTVLLIDHAPAEDLLQALSAALPRVAAVVLWAPGWDEATAVEMLGRHGFEHGSVELLSVPEPGALAVLFANEAAAAESAAALSRPARHFQALAVMPAYNEADVIFHAIGALVSDGIDVYLIDHESTDGTAQAASPWLGRGLVHIERFPDDAGFPERNRGQMVWRDILRRVQDVTREVVSDWYLFVNADEFREAPWPGATLLDGLREVDEVGYSAVNFELFNFHPTDDRLDPGQDPRRHLRHYEAPGRHDLLQIKAWKRQDGPVDLVEHGGHDVVFEGKRVFPVPFILRHYPIRSGQHGARKVLGERLPRFAPEERADGWHVQYDRYADGAEFLRDPATLSTWDGADVRADLLARTTRELILSLCLGGVDPAASELAAGTLCSWMARRGSLRSGAVDELAAAQQRLVAAGRGVDLAPDPALDRVAHDLSFALAGQARLRGNPLMAASIIDAREGLPLQAA
jgi:glycosyltransferase involved in cell wall biosynthesis